MLMTSLLVLQNIKKGLTLLIITNMDGSYHRKAVCYRQSYEPSLLAEEVQNGQLLTWLLTGMHQKNAWMAGEIHHRKKIKFHNQMRKAGRHVLYVCDNASSHQVREYSHIKFFMFATKCNFYCTAIGPGYHLLCKEEIQEV